MKANVDFTPDHSTSWRTLRRAVRKGLFVPDYPKRIDPKYMSAHARRRMVAAGKLRLLPNGNWSMDAES